MNPCRVAFRVNLYWITFLCILFGVQSLPLSGYVIEPSFPIECVNFRLNKSIETFIQPTASGLPISGTFGCVRNSGKKFHEGIDLKSIQKDKKNNPIDPIFAIWPGEVVHLGTQSGAYGLYVVLEHKDFEPALYTLYAHLAKIDSHLKVGDRIQQGAVIGMMGHSSSSPIPKERAHLHFEIGVQLSNRFDSWYKRQNFSVPNVQGPWNGLNLIGIDPLDFFEGFRADKIDNLKSYLQGLPTAFTITIPYAGTPYFINHYPSLLAEPINPKKPIKGWKVEFTWYGFPKSWIPLTTLEGSSKGPILESYDENLLSQSKKRKTLSQNKKGNVRIGSTLAQIIDILFLKT